MAHDEARAATEAKAKALRSKRYIEALLKFRRD
jgi:hypothetical protein